MCVGDEQDVRVCGDAFLDLRVSHSCVKEGAVYSQDAFDN